MHVLITGAGGHLGRKLFDFLEASDHFTVRGLDIRPVDHPNIHLADLSGPPSWVKHLGGVDVIVHLAGDREPTASWKSSVKNNMDATLSLYHHAAAAGVSRVVLASSNWIHGDKRFTNDPLNEETPPGPINAYGMSKLFCERTGAYFAEHQNLSVICLRIGWTQWTHDNQPGTHMAMGRWGQEMWLSDSDFLEGVKAAITVEGVKFAAVNLISNNPGMRWNVEETASTIGFIPKDGSVAQMNFKLRFQEQLKKLVTLTLPRWIEKRFPHW